MKKKKDLPLYEKWMETGEIPGSGLCASFREVGMSYYELDDNFLTNKEVFKLRGWYASGLDTCSGVGQFTPLRQTIVLFMAAMNDEL